MSFEKLFFFFFKTALPQMAREGYYGPDTKSSFVSFKSGSGLRTTRKRRGGLVQEKFLKKKEKKKKKKERKNLPCLLGSGEQRNSDVF